MTSGSIVIERTRSKYKDIYKGIFGHFLMISNERASIENVKDGKYAYWRVMI